MAINVIIFLQIKGIKHHRRCRLAQLVFRSTR